MKIFLGLFYFFKASLLSCHVDVEQGFERGRRHYTVKKIARLPPQINESSGLSRINDSLFYTHNDSGGEPVVYTINRKGEAIDSLRLPVANKDWESIDYRDSERLLYVADVGNNRNNRKDLKVYAYHTGNHRLAATFPISYADQDSFPPRKRERNFDCEAVAYKDGSLFFFSKNRGADRSTKQYTLDLSQTEESRTEESRTAASDEGRTTPVAAATLRVVGQQLLHKQMVTAASINPSGTVLALLTYGRIYLFKIEEGNPDLLAHPWLVIKCNRMQQSEGLTFINDREMLFSNEQGKLFLVRPKKRWLRKMNQN